MPSREKNAATIGYGFLGCSPRLSLSNSSSSVLRDTVVIIWIEVSAINAANTIEVCQAAATEKERPATPSKANNLSKMSRNSRDMSEPALKYFQEIHDKRHEGKVQHALMVSIENKVLYKLNF